MTPNPAAMKFVADRALITGALQVEYRSKTEAKGSSPLAEELFNFPFVQCVFISGNYVTVLKDESLGWEMIVMQLREYIREWLMDHEIAVSAIPSELVNRTRAAADGVDTASTSSNTSNTDYSTFEPTEHDDEIRFLLHEYVRPAVESDGGAITFHSFDEVSGQVKVLLQGSCSGCPSSTMTLKQGIEALLTRMVPGVKEVVAEGV
jgi:Fe-S cluster biogenesis protein NfuA